MSKAPIWPVATDALVADTTHLSTEEFGAYVLLMVAQWRSNGAPLPPDEARLARMARLSSKAWSRVRDTLAELFEISDDGWRQKRVEKDFLTVAEKINENRENGSRGGKAKALKPRKVEVANATNLPAKKPSETVAIHEPYPEPDKKEESSLRSDISAEPLALIPDAAEPLSNPKPKQRAARPPEPSGFDEFYATYPRHVGRPDAAKAYGAALTRASPEVLLVGARRYAAERAGEDQNYTKHPATWLNKDGWLDEAVPHANGNHQNRKSGAATSHQNHLAGLAALVRDADGRSEEVPRPGELALPTAKYG